MWPCAHMDACYRGHYRIVRVFFIPRAIQDGALSLSDMMCDP